MKNRLLPLFVILGTYSVYSQVGIGTKNPDLSTQLHVSAKDKGILIPNVPLTSTTDATTIVNGNKESLLVFNTTDNDLIKPGYYYWFDKRWNRIAVAGESGSGKDGKDGKDGVVGVAGGVIIKGFF